MFMKLMLCMHCVEFDGQIYVKVCNIACAFFLHVFRGKGDYHRLGHGTDDHVRQPKRVTALQGKKVISVACGSLHCVACTDTGEVYTWGDNDEGRLLCLRNDARK